MIREEDEDIIVEECENNEHYSIYENKSKKIEDEEDLNVSDKIQHSYDQLIFKCEGINFPVIKGYNREDTEAALGIIRNSLDLIILTGQIIINDKKALTNTMTREREYIGRPKKKFDSQKDSHFKNIYQKIEDKELNQKKNLELFINKYSNNENCKIIDEEAKFNVDKDKLMKDYNDIVKKNNLPKFYGIVILHSIIKETAQKVKGVFMDYIADFYNKKFKVVMISRNCFFIGHADYDFNTINWIFLKKEIFKRFPYNAIIEFEEDKKEKKRNKINSDYFKKFERKTKLPIIKDFELGVDLINDKNCCINITIQCFDLETFKKHNSKKFDKSECKLLYQNTYMNIILVQLESSEFESNKNTMSSIKTNKEEDSKTLLENINKALIEINNDNEDNKNISSKKYLIKCVNEENKSDLMISSNLKDIVIDNNINNTKIIIKKFSIRIGEIGQNSKIRFELADMNLNSHFFLKMNYEFNICKSNEKNKINAYNMENYYFYKQDYSKLIYFNSFLNDGHIGKKSIPNLKIDSLILKNSFNFSDFNKHIPSINYDLSDKNIFERKFENDSQALSLDNFGVLRMKNNITGSTENFEYIDMNGINKNMYQVVKIFPFKQVTVVVAVKSNLKKLEVFLVNIEEKSNYFYTKKIDILTNSFLGKMKFFTDDSNKAVQVSFSEYKYSTLDHCDKESFYLIKTVLM